MKGYRAFKYKNIHNVVYIFCTSLLFICYLILFNINIIFANHTTPSLKIGSYSIEFNKEFDKYRLYVKKGDEILYSQDNPAILFICENENEVMYNAGYQDIIYDERYIIARASIKTRNNSIIEFEDRYSVNDEGLLFTRDTTVAYANERDIGFSTRFSLYQIKNTSLNGFNIFV